MLRRDGEGDETMKGIRAFFLLIVCGVMGALLLSGIPQQNPATQEELIRQWKNALKEFPPQKNATELEFRFSFPDEELSEKDIYLWEPHNIACDTEGNIYVSDQKQDSILKFDPTGRFLIKKGRKGQGPGDFLNPYCLYVSGKSVFVGDSVKRDIQIFDLELNLVKSFKVAKSYYNLVVSREGLIFATPLRMSSDALLLDVLNGDGVFQYSFGKPMFGSKEAWQIPNFVKLDVDGNEDVFLAFKHMPIVCRYSVRGELRAIYKIDHKGMQRAGKINLDRMNVPGNNMYVPVIYAIRANKNGFFLLYNYPMAEVLEFNENGQPINDYWAIRSHDYMALDFIVRDTNERDQLEILLMQKPENRIEVFRPKR
jgi:hypothetical protein